VARLSASFGVEFWHSFRRPLFIVLAIILLLTAFGLSSGKMQISSGDSSVGGTKAWITSEFAQTQTMSFLALLYYAFFVAVAAGLSLQRDRETRVDALLHATPLSPGEYVWGRFLAVTGGFLALLCLQAGASAFFNHLVPNANAADMRGPFSFTSYFKPVLTMGLPFIVFCAGVSMWVGEKSRSAVVVFVLPVVLLLISGFFLWTWSPSWLAWRVNQVLQVVEPTGYRWLNETYLKVDRGVEFYNHAAVPYVGLFWWNRLWLVVLGLAGVLMTQRLVAKSARGLVPERTRRRWRRAAAAAAPSPEAVGEGASLRALAMTSGVPSFARSVRRVAAAELHELLRQAGLYIFVPVILIQCLGNVLFAVGAFDTPLLLTPGTTAVAAAGQIVTFVLFLLMFYTVESLEREKGTGFASILFASPVRTAAFLTGKALANSVVAVAILLAAFVGCAIALLIQGTVPISLTPYLLVWGLLLLPTFLAWTAFVTATHAVAGNRYGAYALSFALLAFSGYKAITGGMSWAGNWPLWDALRWSDLGLFETDRAALVVNRVMVLGFAVLFTVLAVRLFSRRGRDAVRTMHRLAPARLARTVGGLTPYLAVPATACIALVFMVHNGLEGGVAEKAQKEYWAKNLKTWLDAPLPDIARADIDVKVDPVRHWIESKGTLTLVNALDTALTRIPLTTGLHWKNVTWTMNGEACEPEDSRHLMVFTPPHPLASGDSVVIGWSFDGRFPDGVTKNGGSTREFILPSGVVLTGFQPGFAPVLGYQEDVGETDKNRTEPRRYPRDYWKGVTRGGYGATAWYPARVSVTGPEAYTLNSVGVCTSNTVTDGWRTQVWETDHPVKILNIVCGRWEEKRGQQGTVVYYSDAHPYNVDEMVAALDASRRWYSEWFLPYPWRELKLSEFPGLAAYAQGFGTNITFSENIGFLTKNDVKTDATFLVTAHEAAHQWWGNILTPANGPNGDFLSEGTAHFSTLLLFEQVKGPRARMEFARGIEERYNNRRRPNEERAMYDVDGKRRSDNTVIYDRGGWVFWMVYDFLGHERALEGYRDFFQTWSASRDHPALQDFVAAMRPYAEDPAAYDAFTKQWFEDRVVPQYVVRNANKEADGGGYVVTLTLENIGTGTMPVEVAATAGERWQEPDQDAAEPVYTQRDDYHEARATVTIGGGESREITIRCDFEPERVVVDPDVRILQLKRKQAVATL
jgi:ABC-type transport system involved in multi-copper enzyme maturation permease subunit